MRGAPAIGVTAAYGAYFGARDIETESYSDFVKQFDEVCEVLAATRPTAVNLFWALERMKSLVQANPDQPIGNLKIGEFEVNGIPHAIAIRGRTRVDIQRLCHDLQRVCEQHDVEVMLVGMSRIRARGIRRRG